MSHEVQALAQGSYILWGANCSLYTGKARAYLLKKGIDFIELNTSHPHFHQVVLPKVGFFSIPVLETPEGEIIQDTTDILMFLEARHPDLPMLPDAKPLQALAWLIHNFGSDGLLRPSMWYRWGYKEDNYSYIIDEFKRSMVVTDALHKPESTAMAEAFGGAMDSHLPKLGITSDNTAAIEQSTQQLLRLLNAHFESYPYILGGLPSIADYGLMAGVFAHLARDPHSSLLVKQQAPAVFRWTETMNRPGYLDSELWDVAPHFFTAENLPESLFAILNHIAAEFAPELVAVAECYDDWLQQNPQAKMGEVVGGGKQKQIRPSLGKAKLRLGETTFEFTASPDTLWTYQLLQHVVNVMSAQEREQYETLLKRCGGELLLSLNLRRALTRRDYNIVLAD